MGWEKSRKELGILVVTKSIPLDSDSDSDSLVMSRRGLLIRDRSSIASRSSDFRWITRLGQRDVSRDESNRDMPLLPSLHTYLAPLVRACFARTTW